MKTPLGEKYCLTITEAAEYFEIGVKKMRWLINEHPGEFSIMNGTKNLIIRKKFEEFLDRTESL